MNDHPSSPAARSTLRPEAEPDTAPATHLIDGVIHPSYPGALRPAWVDAADRHGFDVVGRVRDKDHLVLRCRVCAGSFIVRVSVVRDARPLCHACIRSRRAAEAADLGVTLIGPAGDDRHCGLYALPCGHVVRRQYQSLLRAKAAGFALDCETCRETGYAQAARPFGWTLVGPPLKRKPGYRSYRHGCGHVQDISVGNMSWGDCACAQCGHRWNARPSFIYLFAVDLPDLPVVKLGYSARPAKRLRHQLGIAPDTPHRILRILPLASGRLALHEELACHGTLHKAHPDMVVPKASFGTAINTLGEIYHAAAAPLIHTLLDAVAARHPQDETAPTAASPEVTGVNWKVRRRKPSRTATRPKRKGRST